MTEIARTRDVAVIVKDAAYTVLVDAAMRAGGWQGGQGVRWVDSPRDEFLVTYSDGQYGGFLLWGSNEPADQFVGTLEQQPTYGYGTFCTGSWVVATRTFERYTYASRTGGGPLVPITYTVAQPLLFSLRGYWTNEDEWTLSGDPRAPNTFFVGRVAQTPVLNSLGVPYLTLQTGL
jgi:hypothetical protein